MREEDKDRVENIAAATAEALISAVPVLGGPAAVIVNRAFGSAVQRRNERIMQQFEADIAALQAAGKMNDWESVLTSEEFMAALHITFEAAQKTTSEEKRSQLRHALINGFVAGPTPVECEHLLELAVALDPEDVVILDLVKRRHDSNVERRLIQNLAASIREQVIALGVDGESTWRRFKRLVELGLIQENSRQIVKEEQRHVRYGQTRTEQLVQREVWHGISDSGRRFLDFVHDPLAGGEA